MSDLTSIRPAQAPGTIDDLLGGEPIRRSQIAKKPNRLLEFLYLIIGLGVIAGIVYGGALLLGTTILSPKAWAERYLAQIAEGDFAGATATVDPELDETQRALLESAVPSSTIEDVIVTELAQSGPTARVHVAFTLGGEPQETELSLWRRISFFGLASEWRISTPLYGSLRLTSTGPDQVRVGGVPVSVPGTASFAAYPAVYPIELASGDTYFELAEPVSAAVPANNVVEVAVSVSATEAYVEAATLAVHAIIDECATSTNIAPAGCPFGAVLYDEYRNLTWKITDYPELAISEDGTHFESTGRGRAYAKFQQENFAGRDWIEGSYTDKFHVKGTLTIVEGEVVAAFDDGRGGTVG